MFYFALNRTFLVGHTSSNTFASVNGYKRGGWNLLKFSERVPHIYYVGEKNA